MPGKANKPKNYTLKMLPMRTVRSDCSSNEEYGYPKKRNRYRKVWIVFGNLQINKGNVRSTED